MPAPITPTGSSNCGADSLAQGIFDTLIADYTFNLPAVDLNGVQFQLPPKEGLLYTEPVKLTNADLTTGVVGGTGTFDVLMASMYEHIRTEFDQGRITADQYAKVYIELTTAGLSTASQYLLGKDQAHWAAINAQLQARRAEIEAVMAGVQLEVSKAELAIRMVELQNQEANYALTKMKIATEDAQFCQIKAQTLNIQLDYTKGEFELNNLMPLQETSLTLENQEKTFTITQMLPTQRAGLVLENSTREYNLVHMMPVQRQGLILENDTKGYTLNQILPQNRAGLVADVAIKNYSLNQLMPLQRQGLVWDNETKEYNVIQIMPQQRTGLITDNSTKSYQLTQILPESRLGAIAERRIKEYTREEMLPTQNRLVHEQMNVQRAQTSNTRRQYGSSESDPVTGVMGKQKELYDQQIDSYVKDGQYKAAKMFLDGWIVQKTANELTEAPEQLRNETVNEVMNRMQTIHNLRP